MWGDLASFLGAYRVPLLIALVAVVIAVNTIVLTTVIRRAAARLVRRADKRDKTDVRAVAAHEQLVRRARTASTVAVNVVIWTQVAVATVVILGLLGAISPRFSRQPGYSRQYLRSVRRMSSRMSWRACL